MSYHYVPARGGKPGYWMGSPPTWDDIVEMFAEYGRHDWYRVIVTGIPCVESPDWIEAHIKEASTGLMTASHVYEHTQLTMAIANSSDATEFDNAWLAQKVDYNESQDCWEEVTRLILVDL